ncbi:hypothetical protein DQG23_15375 [Paenibacillus contaminans]|uniref:Uncharacterized protein n=1 Tax=Paenibacillus contaminans TaxID=450362 RepID=A0A329MKH2_9BACL|nr:hypothetical protein DQG23_15375 [Paenibacillus contaminans]
MFFFGTFRKAEYVRFNAGLFDVARIHPTFSVKKRDLYNRAPNSSRPAVSVVIPMAVYKLVNNVNS